MNLLFTCRQLLLSKKFNKRQIGCFQASVSEAGVIQRMYKECLQIKIEFGLKSLLIFQYS